MQTIPSHLQGRPGRLLFITGEYPPMPGGLGAYTAELASALTARGWQVSVLTSTGAQSRLGIITANGISVYPEVRRWGWSIWRAGLRLARRIGADWMHVQYQTGAFGMHPAINLAPRWWRARGSRVAWTYHDVLPPYLFPKAGSRLRRWVTEQPAVAAQLTVVTNEGDRQALANVARRLAIVPIGSNIQARTSSAEERRAQRTLRGFGADDIVIGYFGFLNRSKGGLVLVNLLAQLVDRLPTVKLLMIGEQVGASDASNRQYLHEVETAIHDLGLASRIAWTGNQPEAGVSAALNACDLLVMPYVDGASLRRGTLMACLAHGCAIITTLPRDPIPELTDGRELLYVLPDDVDAAAAAVMRLVQDPALAASLRTHARAASAAFTWEGIAEAHERLYWAE